MPSDEQYAPQLVNPSGPELQDWPARAPGPTGMFVDVDDILVWSTWSLVGTQPATLSMRILRADGTIVPVFLQMGTGASSFTPAVQKTRLVAGYILSCVVTCRIVAFGEVYTTVEIQRGAGSGDATLGTLILAGKPSNVMDVCYPTLQPEPADHGFGAMGHLSLANPAPGTDWSFVIPAGMHDRYVGVKAIFTANATVANRLPRIQLSDGSNIACDIPTAAVITAGQAAILNWHPGNTLLAVATPVVIMTMGFPVHNREFGGFQINSLTSGIQAGDQWSGIVLYRETWFGA